jgi:serine protease
VSKINALAFALLCLTICSSYAVASDLEYVPGELIVQFKPKPDGKQHSLSEKNQILNSLDGATIKRISRHVPGLTLVKLPTGQTVEDALETLNRTDGILLAAPNHKLKYASTLPNDTRFNDLWGLHNTGQTGGTPDADIDAPEAWDISTHSDIVVAVLDSGVDYTHPDLAANMWHNPGEIPDNGVDDDNNGLVDDNNGLVDDFYGHDSANDMVT